MNPKEIAKDIFSKFNDLLNPDTETYNCTEAKDCSLIAIDLILKAIKQGNTNWEEVRKGMNDIKENQN